MDKELNIKDVIFKSYDWFLWPKVTRGSQHCLMSVWCYVIYVLHIGVSRFLVEGMETYQFVDINEDVALH